MSFNLMNIGTSGVRASSELLQTTSRNIANLNTVGYVRERTEHSTLVGNQVGRGETVRLINEFAQKQLYRDISSQSYYEQFVTESARVDTLFGEESNNLNTSINSLFNNLQEAMNLPSSTVTRSLFLTDAQNMIDQMDRLSGIVFDQSNIVNEQLAIYSQEANNLIQKISDLNGQVGALNANPDSNNANSVLNERDQSIKELSELVDIEVLDGSNGEKLVFLGTGQAVVMENGTFNLFSLDGDPDPNRKELTLDVTQGSAIALEVDQTKLQGKIGGLLAFRDEILVPAQNQLGQIALSLADAFNQQNRLGMDLDGNLGGDLFSIPTTSGFPHRTNTSATQLSATLEPGKGDQIPATDFRVTYNAGNVTIAAIDAYGNTIGTPTNVAYTDPLNSTTAPAGTELYGLQINFTDVSGAAALPNDGDIFDIKLNSAAAGTLSLATDRPESVALASPIRTESSADNVSNATISVGSVTNTDPATSNFAATNPPSLAQGTITIQKTGNPDEYTITDGNGTTTFTAAAPRENILASAGGVYANYGFDFDIDGEPATGDTYTIEFNEGGFDDNRNGLILSQLQSGQLVRQNVVTTTVADNHKTFNEAYAGLVTEIGVVANQAKTNGAAYDALAAQSEAWFESVAGVNLDEEAANLLRFQQSYTASAQILSAARTVFDTLINAAR
ncbi:flagellar hook-associated protein FlgK [Pseudoalteromonas luteoviolacea]|uniref:Flagellar hook-associated protein 1 n=1 Tax=Pseudoalteromonas luteoviolacea H33 TaxID=1365251 RepID=A0A161XVM7_9GAMM|nr:flagellar hook-associated protein FlgK [Pseudoalteromonas luteoviolacea]KZN47209.1 flagellar hook-associated protein FlgK [Pseudoalteromonas luteoviolacea H33]KZN77175.1 flagellar hook-associated protein FlgK [Pseudoalteromonas luteoviolacea H33-S]MBQ4879328.1 flagellar hook-associated protein FlgK [Pseudoalteromonas luteoviolacea]MBQ4908388.1 flagellar hook-associated protein FlgK [Pseudoalteromonas luteoviolacea]MCF6440328.1 flagellar hook-associated protein FlgK [Pseudoalteromonas luteov